MAHYLGPATHVGDRDGASTSWFWRWEPETESVNGTNLSEHPPSPLLSQVTCGRKLCYCVQQRLSWDSLVTRSVAVTHRDEFLTTNSK